MLLWIKQKRTEALSRRGERRKLGRALKLDGFLVVADLTDAVLSAYAEIACFDLDATRSDGTSVISVDRVTVNSFHVATEIVDGEIRRCSSDGKTDQVSQSDWHRKIKLKTHNCVWPRIAGARLEDCVESLASVTELILCSFWFDSRFWLFSSILPLSK